VGTTKCQHDFAKNGRDFAPLARSGQGQQSGINRFVGAFRGLAELPLLVCGILV